MDDIKILDATALKALAHPLRVQLYELLQSAGPSTATALGQRLGETSGATSYHLRQLHRAGLIEEDREKGNRRERWWRSAQRGITLNSSALPDDASTQAAAMWLVREVDRRRAQWVEHWHDEAADWPRQWRDASLDSDWTLRLQVDQLQALRDEVYAVVERYRKDNEWRDEAHRTGQGTGDDERVAVIFHAFPQHTQTDTEDER